MKKKSHQTNKEPSGSDSAEVLLLRKQAEEIMEKARQIRKQSSNSQK